MPEHQVEKSDGMQSRVTETTKCSSALVGSCSRGPIVHNLALCKNIRSLRSVHASLPALASSTTSIQCSLNSSKDIKALGMNGLRCIVNPMPCKWTDILWMRGFIVDIYGPQNSQTQDKTDFQSELVNRPSKTWLSHIMACSQACCYWPCSTESSLRSTSSTETYVITLCTGYIACTACEALRKHSEFAARFIRSSNLETDWTQADIVLVSISMVGKRSRRAQPDGKHIQNLGEQLEDPAQNGVRVSPAASISAAQLSASDLA